MCPLRQITREVASEIFHFVWLDASVLLLKKKKTSLRKQKYPIALIENSIKRALQVPLNELTKPKEKGREEIIPFVSTHNPNNPNIFHKTNI